ncbi:MAG: hypothetical protein IJ468_15600 [Lachnospiraceae bacterium]|nr:hypothetical protein [Lachnospiraceae bacterium]
MITLVLLFSPDPWDGPLSLHEMIDLPNKSLLSFVPDYKIHLIAPNAMSQEDFDKLHTSLREVLLYIKHTKDKKVLHKILSTDTRFKTVDRTAAFTIRAVTGTGLHFEQKSEVVDMCQAVDEMIEDGIMECIQNLMDSMSWTINQSMDALKIPEEKRAGLKEKIACNCNAT